MNTKKIAVSSMILLQGAEGVADSRILGGFHSMIESEAVARARAAGYEVYDRYCHTGEFGLDVIGESGFAPALCNGSYLPDGTEKVLSGEIDALLSLDVNGSPRRGAATAGLVNMKPTYGTVSRYGVVPIASSADTVTVTAMTASKCSELLSVISGRDEKDPTTVEIAPCNAKNNGGNSRVLRIGICNDAVKTADSTVIERYNDTVSLLTAVGAEIIAQSLDIQNILTVAHAAWNTVLCAEARGNLSRYDGVRYGSRASRYEDLNEMYLRTRSEGFGALTKSVLLYGSYALSPDCKSGGFFKAAQAREWVKAQVKSLFENTDVILLPACSVANYTDDVIKKREITAFSENFYTALPSLCGLPTVTVNGVQLIGKPFSDNLLLSVANQITDGQASACRRIVLPSTRDIRLCRSPAELRSSSSSDGQTPTAT